MQTIKNQYLTVKISEVGAEIQSIKSASGTEFMWEGKSDIWDGKAPVLFPICGGLKDDTYTYNGKSYKLPKHGFARTAKFIVESEDEQSCVYLFKSNEETKAVYPFEFELRAIFKLSGRALEVTYDIKNLTDGEMYMNIGAHEAYTCPEGIENYTVIFDEVEQFEKTELDGNYLSYETKNLGAGTNVFPLRDEYFEIDAIPFLNLRSRGASLVHNAGTRKIHVEYQGFPYVLLWTKYKAPYMCIEPWTGIPDRVDADGDITKKEGIICIPKGEKFCCVHTMTFED